MRGTAKSQWLQARGSHRFFTSVRSLNCRNFNFSGFFIRSETTQGTVTTIVGAKITVKRAPIHISDLVQKLLHPAVQRTGRQSGGKRFALERIRTLPRRRRPAVTEGRRGEHGGQPWVLRFWLRFSRESPTRQQSPCNGIENDETEEVFGVKNIARYLHWPSSLNCRVKQPAPPSECAQKRPKVRADGASAPPLPLERGRRCAGGGGRWGAGSGAAAHEAKSPSRAKHRLRG